VYLIYFLSFYHFTFYTLHLYFNHPLSNESADEDKDLIAGVAPDQVPVHDKNLGLAISDYASSLKCQGKKKKRN